MCKIQISLLPPLPYKNASNSEIFTRETFSAIVRFSLFERCERVSLLRIFALGSVMKDINPTANLLC